MYVSQVITDATIVLHSQISAVLLLVTDDVRTDVVRWSVLAILCLFTGEKRICTTVKHFPEKRPTLQQTKYKSQIGLVPNNRVIKTSDASSPVSEIPPSGNASNDVCH